MYMMISINIDIRIYCMLNVLKEPLAWAALKLFMTSCFLLLNIYSQMIDVIDNGIRRDKLLFS